MSPLFMFTFFSDVKTFDRSVVSHYAGVDETLGPPFSIVLEQGLGLDWFSDWLHSFLDFG